METGEWLVVLYHSDRNGQTWSVYRGGSEEADSEFELMRKSDKTVQECSRIKVITSHTAFAESFSIPTGRWG